MLLQEVGGVCLGVCGGGGGDDEQAGRCGQGAGAQARVLHISISMQPVKLSFHSPASPPPAPPHLQAPKHGHVRRNVTAVCSPRVRNEGVVDPVGEALVITPAIRIQPPKPQWVLQLVGGQLLVDGLKREGALCSQV